MEPVGAITKQGQGAISPLALSPKALGGGDLRDSVGQVAQRGASGSTGLNNIGLLIRTWGELRLCGASEYCIDYGNISGIRCSIPADVAPLSNLGFIGITGILSCEMVDNEIKPVILPRRQSDITQYR